MVLRTCVAAAILTSAGCSGPSRPAVGTSSEVVVWSASDPATNVLERVLTTDYGCGPRTEPAFRVQRTADSETVRLARNVVVLATRESASAPALKGFIPAAAWPDPAAFRIAVHRDLGARAQVVVLVSTSGLAALDTKFEAIAAAARESLECAVRRRMREQLLAGTTSASWGEGAGAELDFVLRMPAEYERRPRSAAWPDAAEYVRGAPLRTLLVFWVDGVDDLSAARPDYVRGLLRDVLWRLHGDTVIEAATRIEPGRLGGYPALAACSVWQNRAEVGGGPLRAWFVRDPNRARLYGVAAAVCAPGHDTVPSQRELQALAETFRCGKAP